MFPDTQISPGVQNHSWLRTATTGKRDWTQDKKRHKKKECSTMKQTISKAKRQLSEWKKIITDETTDKELVSKIYKVISSIPEK